MKITLLDQSVDQVPVSGPLARSDLSRRFEGESVGRALELVGERWTLLILLRRSSGAAGSVSSCGTLAFAAPCCPSRLQDARQVGLFGQCRLHSD